MQTVAPFVFLDTMAKLSTKTRDDMSLKEFALPGRRFPLSDKNHDRAAISGATRAYKAGNISLSQMSMIKKKAKAKLGNNASEREESSYN